MDYEPDPLVMCQDEMYSADNLIELAPGVPGGRNNLDDNNARGGGQEQSAFDFTQKLQRILCT